MGEVYYGIHEEIAEMLTKRNNLKAFVETGTWHGDSAKWASSRFDNVITIEIIEEYFTKARFRFLGYNNVLCVYGDSREILSNIVTTLLEPALFWLDAHWTGHPDYKREYGKCAVIEEIKAINKSRHKNVIMVDDVRLFPSMMKVKASEVIKLLSDNNKRIVTVKDDIFYAEPNTEEHYN